MNANPPAGGIVSLFARHPTAGNLLMIIMLLVGVLSLIQLKRQFFPDFGIDVVTVTIVWSGATAEDVEATIIEAIEPELRFLDSVKRVNSTAKEGRAIIGIEFEAGTEMQKAYSDVEQAVSQVTTLPQDSERPEISRVVRYDTIARLVLSGDTEEATIKRQAKLIRDDLLDAGVDRVTLFGARDEEIRVEIEPFILRQLDLRLEDIAQIIGRSSQDVPAGDLGGSLELQPRALGEADTAADVAAIDIIASPDGRRLTVGDIATIVEDRFDENESEGRRQGNPAIELHVERALSADALTVAAIVDEYLAQAEQALPQGMVLERYDVVAQRIQDRIDLLIKNGVQGLILVLFVLFLFLNTRVAFWVAVGIPVSLSAMLGVLWLAGMTINMLSLFAMLLAIGIVVDDAIVVGEHAVAMKERGHSAQEAAELGALRMLAPVTSASLTTIAAFLPLMMIGGIIGTIIGEIPVVVIFVLLASLVECLLVLPTHMRGALLSMNKPPSRFRQTFNDGFARFRDGPFRRLVIRAIDWRYATIAIALTALIVTIGAMIGGRVGFVFFKPPEAENIEANLAMAPGTSRERTIEVLDLIEQAALQAELDLTGEQGSLILMAFGQIGKSVGNVPGIPSADGDNVAGIHLELVRADTRDVRNTTFIDAWQERIPTIAGLDTFAIKERTGGPPGREVDIRLRGGQDLDALKTAALEVKDALARLPGVSQIADDLAYGKEEIIVELTPRGRTLGFTTEEVGRQLRDAFDGGIAKRFAREDEEVEINVRLVEDARIDPNLERFYLRAPDGAEVSLGEVATLRPDRGFAQIRRKDGQREVSVTAELDEALIRLELVQEALVDEVKRLTTEKGFQVEFAGRAEEQADTLADIRIGAVLGLSLMYIILAWVFASFTRPFAVMLVIPFGLVGAVLGHMVFGYDMTILSLIALLGLSGILVNDSIILVTTIDEKIRDGDAVIGAIIDGACERFRAVLLTSLTTIGGLVPLLFEKSFQAQFLIPMALTLVFGLMVTTFLVLLIVPAVMAVQQDIRSLFWRNRPNKAALPAA